MNLDLAKTFLEVVEVGNLNRAAARLAVTQSTVTMRLNTLETGLGQQLLIRNKSGVQLTAAGIKFRQHAELLIQIWRQAQSELKLPEGFDSTLNLGCRYDLWLGVVNNWLKEIRDFSSQVALVIWPGFETELQTWLENRVVDVIVTLDTNTASSYKNVHLFDDLLIQVSKEKRRLVRWDPTYIYVDLGEEFRKQHTLAYPVEETPAISFANPQWALEYLLENGGSGYFPSRMVRPYLETQALYIVEDSFEFKRSVYVCFEKNAIDRWPWLEALLNQWRNTASQTNSS